MPPPSSPRRFGGRRWWRWPAAGRRHHGRAGAVRVRAPATGARGRRRGRAAGGGHRHRLLRRPAARARLRRVPRADLLCPRRRAAQAASRSAISSPAPAPSTSRATSRRCRAWTPWSPPPPADHPAASAQSFMVGSDIHANWLTLPAFARYADHRPVFLVGDFALQGTPMEASIAQRAAALGHPTVAVSGNHDSPVVMRRPGRGRRDRPHPRRPARGRRHRARPGGAVSSTACWSRDTRIRWRRRRGASATGST